MVVTDSLTDSEAKAVAVGDEEYVVVQEALMVTDALDDAVIDADAVKDGSNSVPAVIHSHTHHTKRQRTYYFVDEGKQKTRAKNTRHTQNKTRHRAKLEKHTCMHITSESES